MAHNGLIRALLISEKTKQNRKKETMKLRIKKISIATAIAAGVMTASMTSADTVNLLTNGGFDANTTGNINLPAGWTGVGLFKQHSSGGYNDSKFVSARSAGDLSLQQSGPIDFTEDKLSLTGWYILSGSSNPDTFAATLSIWDTAGATGTKIASVNTGKRTSIDSWTNLSLQVDIPDGAASWSVSLECDNVGGNYYSGKFDDMTLAAVPEPATMSIIIAFGGGCIVIRRFFMI